VALAPQHGRARAELLRHADVAMYRAKQRGTGVELYTPEGDVHTRDRLQLANDLRRALDVDELVLHFQPKCDLATGQVSGVEALARWQHPERGLLYPDAFIELAEQHGLMRPLTLNVLAMAARQRRAWSRAGFELSVAVNVSAANLLDARFPTDVAELLERHEVPAGGLQLEITENTIMVDPGRALDVLARLGELGISFALDDFGTGYSSLAYLKRLPVDELKIDKSFVMDMTTDADDATIVRSTVELARNLGLRVVAEGVETAEHWRELSRFGCHTAQGYYLSRPLPAGQLTHWLTRRLDLGSPADGVGPTAQAVLAAGDHSAAMGARTDAPRTSARGARDEELSR
jgi:diguanylate cyclase